MELRHLRYFVAVAEELNFTRAAARLHIAQPPLSTQIRALEGELGVDLFLRENRRVYLTQAGEELLARARLILGAAHEAGVAVRNAASGIIGRVTLGYVASAMFSDRLPAVIRRFQRSHRHVELILVEKTSLDQIAALHERRMDVGVLRKPDLLLPESVAVEEWHQSLLIAAIPKDHELAKLDSVRIGDLRDQPIITYPRDRRDRSLLAVSAAMRKSRISTECGQGGAGILADRGPGRCRSWNCRRAGHDAMHCPARRRLPAH